MDFITHSLVGAGVARLACPKKEWLPQLTLAGLLGSLAMDGDSWLAFINQDAYGLYHRVGVDAFNIAHPASLVIDRTGTVRYVYRGKNQSDRAPVEQILETLTKL